MSDNPAMAIVLFVIAVLVGWYFVNMARYRAAQRVNAAACERLVFLLIHEMKTWEDLDKLGVWKMLERGTLWAVKNHGVTPHVGGAIAKAASLPVLYQRIERALGQDAYYAFRERCREESRKNSAAAGSYVDALEQWLDETDYEHETAAEHALKLKVA